KTHKDTDLREALRRKYANTPQIPADFSERLMKRMEESVSAKKPRHRHVWLYATIGTIAASILLLLTLPYINKVETKEQPVVTQRHVKQDITMKSEKQLQPQETSIVVSNVQPKHSNIVRKRHDSAKEEDTLSSSSERLQYYIAKLEAEMKNLDDSVREAHLEKLIAADEHLQQLVYSIVNDKAEQTINELRKDSTANYINF
ncbi:MAG: hypothetical protein II658_08190, partial [Prevotella sp.]|nr:hypothetical protein [Prevotella sp.]